MTLVYQLNSIVRIDLAVALSRHQNGIIHSSCVELVLSVIEKTF